MLLYVTCLMKYFFFKYASYIQNPIKTTFVKSDTLNYTEYRYYVISVFDWIDLENRDVGYASNMTSDWFAWYTFKPGTVFIKRMLKC